MDILIIALAIAICIAPFWIISKIQDILFEKKTARAKANGTYQEQKTLLPRPDSRGQGGHLIANYWEEYNRQRTEIAKELQVINFSHMLGLPNLTQEKYTLSAEDAIVHAHNPLNAFKSHIKPGKPSVAEFCLCMETMFNQLTEEMQFSESDKNDVYAELIPMLICGTTVELIEQILQSYAVTIPPSMKFLKNKINYELVTLGHIMQYGIDQQRSDICEKVNEHRRKRGYI